MTSIFLWTFIALFVGLYQGYVHQTTPDFILCFVIIVCLNYVELIRWSVVHRVTICEGRKDPRWRRQLKVAGVAMLLAYLVGAFVGLDLSK